MLTVEYYTAVKKIKTKKRMGLLSAMFLTLWNIPGVVIK